MLGANSKTLASLRGTVIKTNLTDKIADQWIECFQSKLVQITLINNVLLLIVHQPFYQASPIKEAIHHIPVSNIFFTS